MATLSQTQSASLDANYNQEFVDWTTAKYGSDAQNILTNVRSAQGAATEFMHERLEPEIMRNYGARTDQVNSEPLQPARSLDAAGASPGGGTSLPAGSQASGQSLSGTQSAHGRERASGASQEAVVTNGRATDVSAHQGERNLSASAGAPSQAMREDFRSGSKRVSEQAAVTCSPLISTPRC